MQTPRFSLICRLNNNNMHSHVYPMGQRYWEEDEKGRNTTKQPIICLIFTLDNTNISDLSIMDTCPNVIGLWWIGDSRSETKSDIETRWMLKGNLSFTSPNQPHPPPSLTFASGSNTSKVREAPSGCFTYNVSLLLLPLSVFLLTTILLSAVLFNVACPNNP